MDKIYFKIMFAVYFTALAVCGALRVVLKLSFIDLATGFYQDSASSLPLVFNIVLGAGLILMLLLNIIKKGSHDYKVDSRSSVVPVLGIIAGLSILCFAWLGLPEHFGQKAAQSETWGTTLVIINYTMGALAGLSIVYSGLRGFLSSKQPNPIIMLIPPIWQLVLLLSRFNGYFSVLYISDNLLAVLFMIFAALFYLGHARTLCGLGRKDSRNYVISAGLGASLCGFLLSVPNLVYMVVNTAAIPVAEMTVFECIYTLSLSVYSLIFTVSYARSIKRV